MHWRGGGSRCSSDDRGLSRVVMVVVTVVVVAMVVVVLFDIEVY